MNYPIPGTIGLSRIGGVLGRAIALGQHLVGDTSIFTHAFVVVDERTIIQAMPGGAEYADLSPYLVEDHAIFLRDWVDPINPATVRAASNELVGAPYGYADYLALAVPPRLRPGFLRRFVESPKRLICSQLCVEVIRRCSRELPGLAGCPASDITPGDLHIAWSKHLGGLK